MLRTLDATGLADNTRVLYTSDHGDNLGARGLWGKSTMYEEVAGVPLIIKGPDIPRGVKIAEPASHVDTYPFILECADASVPEAYDTHPGKSLFKLAGGARPDRNVLTEYHGMGSTTGAFMIRHGKYKYVHYVAYPPQLFDLEARSRGTGGSCRETRIRTASSPPAASGCTKSATLPRSMRARSGGRPNCSKRTAAATW